MSLLKLSTALSLILCIWLSACATRLEYNSPETVNLSGTWVLQAENSQEIILAPPKQRVTSSKPSRNSGDASRGDRSRGENASRNRRSGAFEGAARARLEKPEAMTSTKMTIEQSQDSMGVRYDNGKYRDVDWGKKEYRVVTIIAGWERDILRINTKGKKLSYSESYTLDEAGEFLTVDFKVAGKEYSRMYTLKMHNPG